MTDDEIRAIQRIGRDFAGRMSTVGLVELDALCEEAIERGRKIRKLEGRVDDAVRAVVDHVLEPARPTSIAEWGVGEVHSRTFTVDDLAQRVRDLEVALATALDGWHAWLTAETRGPQPQHDQIAELRALLSRDKSLDVDLAAALERHRDRG